MTILVTGGAGFIGSNFILDWFRSYEEPIVTIDNLTYAANLSNLNSIIHDPRHYFFQTDINDTTTISQLLHTHQIRAVLHFAAESHVDRSITDPSPFIRTNILGSFNLLECVRKYWNSLNTQAQADFRFIQISTDEVYGSLTPNEPAFTESNRYQPNSPYSASKASADHLVRAYFHTYGIPVITTNCSNNYGPHQFQEKFIPKCIYQALTGANIPIYGDGQQIRDWLYVGDHCSALRIILAQGKPGEVYNIGANNEKKNIDLAYMICSLLDKLCGRFDGQSYNDQIKFVTDRCGHDKRYAINTSKIEQELGWCAKEAFSSGLMKTINWYLKSKQWQLIQPKVLELESV